MKCSLLNHKLLRRNGLRDIIGLFDFWMSWHLAEELDLFPVAQDSDFSFLGCCFCSFIKSNRIEVSKHYCCVKQLPWRNGLLFIEIFWPLFLIVQSSLQQFKPSYSKVSFLFFFSYFWNYLILIYLITIFCKLGLFLKFYHFSLSFQSFTNLQIL